MPRFPEENRISSGRSRPGPKTGWQRPNIVHRHGCRAVIYCDNKEYYLGTWDGIGTPPDDVLEAYKRQCLFLEEQYHAKKAGVAPPDPTKILTVDEAIALYLTHLERDEDGDLRADGTLSTHYERAIMHLRPLSALFGHVPAEELTAAALKQYRKAIREPNPTWHEGLPSYQPDQNGKRKRPPKQWSIFSANCAVQNVVRFFSWLESDSLVPRGMAEHLMTVTPLRQSEKYEAATVDDCDLAAVLKLVSPQIGAILKLERITAARSGEICRMRPCDIDAESDIWVYVPRDEAGRLKHKNSWRGHNRAIPLGPEAQAVIVPFLEGRADTDYLFTPSESRAWYTAERIKKAGGKRKTPVYPSELSARQKRRDARKNQQKRRTPRPFFDSRTVRKAVLSAVAKLRSSGEDVRAWSPKSLRHTRITEIQRVQGWEAGQAVAGHKSIQATAKYAHEQHLRACKIAGEAQVFSPLFGVAETIEQGNERRDAS